jgi:hypothetical protein
MAQAMNTTYILTAIVVWMLLAAYYIRFFMFQTKKDRQFKHAMGVENLDIKK